MSYDKQLKFEFPRLDSCYEALDRYGEALDKLEEQIENVRSADDVDNRDEMKAIRRELIQVDSRLDNMSIFAEGNSGMAEYSPKNLRGEDRWTWIRGEQKAYLEMVDKGFIDQPEDIEVEPTAFFNYALTELEQREDKLLEEYGELS